MAPLLTNTLGYYDTLLRGYAERGVFRSYSGLSGTNRSALCQFDWHLDQRLELRISLATQTARFDCLLPELDGRSSMFRDYKLWLQGHSSAERPKHRHSDPAKVQLRALSGKGRVGLQAKALDNDLEYAIKRLIAVTNELYMQFLNEGQYYEWKVETFDINPDAPH